MKGIYIDFYKRVLSISTFIKGTLYTRYICMHPPPHTLYTHYICMYPPPHTRYTHYLSVDQALYCASDLVKVLGHACILLLTWHALSSESTRALTFESC